MTAIPRYRPVAGPALFSAGFRPFFLAAAIWAGLAIPLWLAAIAGFDFAPMPSPTWHVHEMTFGFGVATVAGFLLTAVPNWTGRMPLQGAPLVGLLLLWIAGRLAMLASARIGAAATAGLDLLFLPVFLCAIGREILAGRNWRNLPVLAALALLCCGNALVHVGLVTGADTETTGNHLGIATLLALITLVGGRIIPSFTRNWLAKQRPDLPPPAAFGAIDRLAMGSTVLALGLWTILPRAALAAGFTNALRLARWRGTAVLREPLLWILHLGYAWLALGLLLLAASRWTDLLPATASLHALTAGAIGTMTLAVMTRASLGHTGRPLVAGTGTTAIYLLVTAAAGLRLLAPIAGEQYLLLLTLAGLAWSGAFGGFVLLYASPLARPRVTTAAVRPI